MISSKTARKELYKASLLKMDILPAGVIETFIDEFLDTEDVYYPAELENIFSDLLFESNINYKYLYMPVDFMRAQEDILMSYNYSIEAIYTFPKLSKYSGHKLFNDFMQNIQVVHYPDNSGGGNLIEFVHLSTSMFASSQNEIERQFATQDPTAFILSVQDNGGIDSECILEFLVKMKDSIDYITKLTSN